MNKIFNNEKYPLVSVITPTYNRATLLEETILSVLNQNYPNLEYIVLDDGSKDDTINIVQKFRNRIIFESHKNIGEVRTINKGFAMIHGEIIGVVNSDDPLLPGAINDFVAFMQKNPEIIVAYSDWVYIDQKGKRIKNVIAKDYDYEYMIKTHDCFLGASAFFRKKILDNLKGRDVRFNFVSDYEFWLRAGLLGNFARIPKILVTSRVHPGQATFQGRSLSMALEHIAVINKIFSNPMLPAYIKKIKAQAYEKACEAARISRGDSFISKVIIALLCLYYVPVSYAKLFLMYRLIKATKI